MKFLLLFTCLISGCAGKVVTDPVLPAIEANYPTAEFRACGDHWLGSGICRVESGKQYSDLELQVQVYYSGTLSVTSRDCQIDTHLSYNGAQLIPITIPGRADRDCLISITVSPVYPNNDNDPIRIYSFRGYLAIKHLESKKRWHGFTRKVTGRFSSLIKIWVGGSKTVQLVAGGCGRKKPIDVKMDLEDGYLIFDISGVVPGGMLPKTCIVTGFIRSRYPDIFFNVLVSKYDERFVTLPIPDVKIDGKKLHVIGDASISIIALNEEYIIDNESKFSFDNFQGNYVRAITTAGRSVLGLWSIPSQKWSWLQ